MLTQDKHEFTFPRRVCAAWIGSGRAGDRCHRTAPLSRKAVLADEDPICSLQEVQAMIATRRNTRQQRVEIYLQ